MTMRTASFVRLIAVLGFLGTTLIAQLAEAQSCSVTISPGSSAASQIASAAANSANSVICLNAGTYGAVNFYNISRSSYVTIQSASGQSASIAPQVGNSKFLRFSNLTFQDFILVNSCSTNIQFVNSAFAPNVPGMAIDASSCPSTTHNLLVDGVSFDKVGQATWEGRLSLRAVNGMIIRNSRFTGVSSVSPSDGIQLIGGTKNVTVGPNNLFDGIWEHLCGGVHCDAIQIYGADAITIDGNLFRNGDTFLMAPDGSTDVVLRNNVFDGTGVAYHFNIQLGTAINPVFSHNTMIGNAAVGMAAKTGNPLSQNCKIENNIFRDTADIYEFYCNGTTSIRNNMHSNAGDVSGVNSFAGTPGFTGGTRPTTMAGFKLAATSPGVGRASDGFDVGTLSSNDGSVAPTPAPTPVPTATPVPPAATPSPTPQPPAATPAPTATPVPPASTPAPTPSTAQRVFTSQVPAQLVNTDGVNYELGMKFVSSVAGKITGVRFYKSPSETGTHVGKVYSSTGRLLGQVTFTNETASGWQEAKFATPISINAKTQYTVSVNTGSTYYVTTIQGLAARVTNATLRSVVSGGVFGPVGQRPTQTWNSSNYFRDVLFVPQ